MFFGAGFLVLVTLVLLIGVANLARARDRMAAAWVTLGVLAGVVGFLLGTVVAGALFASSSLDDAFLLVGSFSPILGALGTMGGIAALLYVLPPHVATGGASWRV